MHSYTIVTYSTPANHPGVGWQEREKSKKKKKFCKSWAEKSQHSPDRATFFSPGPGAWGVWRHGVSAPCPVCWTHEQKPAHCEYSPAGSGRSGTTPAAAPEQQTTVTHISKNKPRKQKHWPGLCHHTLTPARTLTVIKKTAVHNQTSVMYCRSMWGDSQQIISIWFMPIAMCPAEWLCPKVRHNYEYEGSHLQFQYEPTGLT